MVDIIIVGAGPAGLTAAVYARRAGRTVMVLERESFGGQIVYSPKVENYPGFLALSGAEFGEKLVDQAIHHGVELELDEVTAIHDNGRIKSVVTQRTQYQRTLFSCRPRQEGELPALERTLLIPAD